MERHAHIPSGSFISPFFFLTINNTCLNEFLLGLNEITYVKALEECLARKKVIKDFLLSAPLFRLLKMIKSESLSP